MAKAKKEIEEIVEEVVEQATEQVVEEKPVVPVGEDGILDRAYMSIKYQK